MKNFTEELAGNQTLLAQMYSAKQRPQCPCKVPPVEMYIAKIGDHYIIKRMPESGSLHSPDCDSYEPPPELSGLGEVLGSAIRLDAEQGFTELRFDFSMARISGKRPASESGSEKDSIKAETSKLTLRSTLHYLWEQAGLNRWTPAMAGKRTWFVIRKHLLHSAEDKLAKGKSLASQLFIPETFSQDKKDTIKSHWLSLVSRMSSHNNGPRPLMILIGEVKEFVPSRYGYQMKIKHAPDVFFGLHEETYKKLAKRFGHEIETAMMEGIRLITIATFSTNSTGIAAIEEIALMNTTDSWIPFENIFEKALIEKMTEQSRRFTKGMRYNLSTSKPLAAAVLSDTAPQPTACYIVPAEANDEFSVALNQLQSDSQLASWSWNTTDYDPPTLPPASK